MTRAFNYVVASEMTVRHTGRCHATRLVLALEFVYDKFKMWPLLLVLLVLRIWEVLGSSVAGWALTVM